MRPDTSIGVLQKLRVTNSDRMARNKRLFVGHLVAIGWQTTNRRFYQYRQEELAQIEEPTCDRSQALLRPGFYADDLDEAEAFYRDIFSLKVIGREPDHHVFFPVGESVLLVFNPN